MPTAPPKPCCEPGCAAYATMRGRCAVHAKASDARRGNFRQRGYTSEWDALSKRYRQAHPLCEMCLTMKAPVLTPSECVDHIKNHNGDRALLLDRDNLRALCWSCHSRKTVKEDGGFGR